jgi:hypothetical protein
MIKFLAIIAFCFEGTCAFWADTKTPYYTQEECEAVVVSQIYLMANQGVDPETMLPGCIPTKFSNSEA